MEVKDNYVEQRKRAVKNYTNKLFSIFPRIFPGKLNRRKKTDLDKDEEVY